MERPNTVGIIAILGLVIAASMNLMLFVAWASDPLRAEIINI